MKTCGKVIETKEETILTGAVDAETEEGSVEDEEDDPKQDVSPVSENNSIFLGLRVYTHQSDEPVVIRGQLRHELEVSASLALN